MNDPKMLPDDLSIPECLRAEDSPESKAVRERITQDMRHANPLPAIDQRKRKGVPPVFAVPADDAGFKLLEETQDRKAAATLKGLEKLAKWKEENGVVKTATARKVGPKEADLRERRQRPDKLKEIAKPKNGNGKHPVEATISTLPVAAKKAKTVKVKSKLGIATEMLLSKNGATAEELKAATGWSVYVKRIAQRLGKKVKETDGRIRLV